LPFGVIPGCLRLPVVSAELDVYNLKYVLLKVMRSSQSFTFSCEVILS